MAIASGVTGRAGAATIVFGMASGCREGARASMPEHRPLDLNLGCYRLAGGVQIRGPEPAANAWMLSARTRGWPR